MSDTKTSETMNAIAFTEYGDSSVYKKMEVKKPQPEGRQLLVKNYATASNPIDYKVRRNNGKTDVKLDNRKIVGWDSAGVVVAVGNEAKLFKVGEEVMFAGDLTKDGTFAEFTVVDERIVGKKPKSLNFNEAATVPLCSLTAWESLLEELGFQEDAKENATKSIVIINGAGGVGSFAIQIASKILKIGHVIATASREETIAWCKKMGATGVINHHQNMTEQLNAMNLKGVDYVLNCGDSDINFEQCVSMVKTCGKVLLITPITKQNPGLLNAWLKRVSVIHELMFTRSMFNIEPEKQHAILTRVADLIDSGVLKHTMTTVFPFSAEGIAKAGDLNESGKAIGKTAITIVS